jgi:hypothetical protein
MLKKMDIVTDLLRRRLCKRSNYAKVEESGVLCAVSVALLPLLHSAKVNTSLVRFSGSTRGQIGEVALNQQANIFFKGKGNENHELGTGSFAHKENHTSS